MSYRRFQLPRTDLPADATPTVPLMSPCEAGTVAAPVASVANPVATPKSLPLQAEPPTVASVASVARVSNANRRSGQVAASAAEDGLGQEEVTDTLILHALERLLLQHRPGEVSAGLTIARAFLAEHHHAARLLGWRAHDLFGCHPDPCFAAVRYDAMGALTLAVLSGRRIALVTADTMRLENGLAHRRTAASSPTVGLVWEAFGGTS